MNPRRQGDGPADLDAVCLIVMFFLSFGRGFLLHYLSPENAERSSKKSSRQEIFFSRQQRKQNDKAVGALESAYQTRRDALYDVPLDPIFDSVRAEPRVQRMLAAIGAPH
jgi:hypothetical protein